MKRILQYAALGLVMSVLTWITPSAVNYHYLTQETFSQQVPGLAAPTKVIHICASGCAYTTLNAACAVNTSTASSPITFYVHAGQYSSATQQTCSGQDYVTIMGEGPSTRIINTNTSLTDDPNGEGAGDYGTIGMGTSTNWTIHDIYLKGHRAIYLDGNGTGSVVHGPGGGNVTVYNTVLEVQGAQPNEDCMFLRDPADGTRYNFHDNDCTHITDGFTNISGATTWYVSNNVFHTVATSGVGGTGGSYALQAIPSVFIDEGSTFNIGRGATGGGNLGINYSHWFNGGAAAGGNGSECTSGCYAIISGDKIRVDNADANPDAPTVIAIDLATTSGHLANLDVHDTDIKVTTTASTNGITYGVYVAQDTTQVNFHGGRIRTSGGTVNKDFNHTSSPPTYPIGVSGTDYTTASGTIGSSTNALDQRRVYASDWITTGDVAGGYGTGIGGFINVLSTAGAPEGIFLDNTSGSNNNSPKLKLCDGGTERCFSLYVRGSDDHLILYDETGAGGLIDIPSYTSGDFAITAARFYVSYPSFGGSLQLGGGVSTSTNTFLLFDGTNDAQITWFGGGGGDKRLEYTGVEIYRHSTKASPPSSCAIGDQYFDTSGGVCFCTATGTPGTWTNVSGVGNCT